MTANAVYLKAIQSGLELERRGDGLIVRPSALLTDELTALLRAHKPALLALLDAAWLHVAKQTILGEFDGADDRTVQHVTTGLRSIAHPLAARAIERLHLHHFNRR